MSSSALISTVHAIAYVYVQAGGGLPPSLSSVWPQSGNAQEWKYA